MHKIVTYPMLVYFTYLLYYLPPTENKLQFYGLASRMRIHLLENGCHMNKGICVI